VRPVASKHGVLFFQDEQSSMILREESAISISAAHRGLTLDCLSRAAMLGFE